MSDGRHAAAIQCGLQAAGGGPRAAARRVRGTGGPADLDIGEGVLRRWITQGEAGRWEATPGRGLKAAQAQELERLRRENVRLKAERDILKKAAAFFAKESV